MDRLDCVSLYINGWRDVIVLSRRWLLGFLAATLEPVKLDETVTKHARKLDYSRTRLVKRLRANARTYQRRGCGPLDGKWDEPTGKIVFPHKAVRAAIAELAKRD